MNLKGESSIGYNQIYIPIMADPNDNEPKKLPYIKFVIPHPVSKETKKAIDQSGIKPLGIREYSKDYNSITITSTRKVIKAINIFLDLEKNNIAGNEELFSTLKKYRGECIAIHLKKPAKKPPFRSKKINKFKLQKRQVSIEGLNQTEVIRHINSQKTYIHKLNTTGRTISEIEAFNGYCYKLLLGDRHPNVKTTHDTLGHRIGMISEEISGFVSLQNYYKKNGALNKNELIDAEIVKVWVAAYVEEETDLHPHNYGINEDGFFVKIDDDRSTWPLVCKYKGINPEKGSNLNRYYSTPPVSDFDITTLDIREFPFLIDATPYHWVDKESHEEVFEDNTLDELYKDPQFIADKFFMFLKRILIPNEAYAAIGLTIASEKMRQKFVDHKCKKTKELENKLISMDEFQEYIINHPDAIQKIISEFTEYNASYKEKHAFMRINLEKVKEQFINIQKTCFDNKKREAEENQGLIATKIGMFKRKEPDHPTLLPPAKKPRLASIKDWKKVN